MERLTLSQKRGQRSVLFFLGDAQAFQNLGFLRLDLDHLGETLLGFQRFVLNLFLAVFKSVKPTLRVFNIALFAEETLARRFRFETELRDLDQMRLHGLPLLLERRVLRLERILKRALFFFQRGE